MFPRGHSARTQRRWICHLDMKQLPLAHTPEKLYTPSIGTLVEHTILKIEIPGRSYAI